jgi:hypothetical protein
VVLWRRSYPRVVSPSSSLSLSFSPFFTLTAVTWRGFYLHLTLRELTRLGKIRSGAEFNVLVHQPPSMLGRGWFFLSRLVWKSVWKVFVVRYFLALWLE